MHRATWDPSRGQNNQAHLSRAVAPQQLPAHTVLKVRKDAQGGIIDRQAAVVGRRDLKAELEKAEREARNKKRIAQGLPPELEEPASAPVKAIEAGADEEEHAAKRRKLIEEALKLDAEDDSDDEDEDEEEGGPSRNGAAKGKGKATEEGDKAAASSDSSSDSDSDDDDDEEDDTAALLRELEKIKRERQQEKERQEREAAAIAQSEREDEIALGNPLLNLENAIKSQNAAAAAAGGGVGTPNFGVKRRWDDDVIFKNQAAGLDKQDRSSFVNDMTRTEFHKKFLYRYLK